MSSVLLSQFSISIPIYLIIFEGRLNVVSITEHCDQFSKHLSAELEALPNELLGRHHVKTDRYFISIAPHAP